MDIDELEAIAELVRWNEINLFDELSAEDAEEVLEYMTNYEYI